MFEKVLAGEDRRRHQRNRYALAASVLGHVLIAAGATQLPLSTGFRAAAVEEVVSFVDLRLPEVDLPTPPRNAASLLPREERVTPPPAAASGSAPAAAEQTEPAPETLPDLTLVGAAVVPALSPAGAPRLAVYLPDAPRPVVLRDGDVVEADVLAERPRLDNRVEMERLWKQLYPPLLEMRGITGQSLVSFVIDEDGRVIEESVELLSATRDEFGVAALRGVGRLRFRPMRVGGVAVRVRTTLPVVWRLNAA